MRLLFCLTLVLACGRADRELSEVERLAISSAVDSATHSFEEAQRTQDAERTVAHLASDFYMYNDGSRSEYESVVAGIRETFGSLQHLEPGFADLDVKVLGPDAAVVSFTFRDSIATASGDLVQFRGATTLVWERRGRDWLITYADADHYAIEPPQAPR